MLTLYGDIADVIARKKDDIDYIERRHKNGLMNDLDVVEAVSSIITPAISDRLRRNVLASTWTEDT